MLLAQPVINPALTSPVVTPSTIQPSDLSAVDRKVDDSQVFLLSVPFFLRRLAK
jgi:hypothetical protein